MHDRHDLRLFLLPLIIISSYYNTVAMWFRKFLLDFFRTNLYQNFPLSFYSTRKCMAYIRYWVRSKSMPWRVDGQVWHIYAWLHAWEKSLTFKIIITPLSWCRSRREHSMICHSSFLQIHFWLKKNGENTDTIRIRLVQSRSVCMGSNMSQFPVRLQVILYVMKVI